MATQPCKCGHYVGRVGFRQKTRHTTLFITACDRCDRDYIFELQAEEIRRCALAAHFMTYVRGEGAAAQAGFARMLLDIPLAGESPREIIRNYAQALRQALRRQPEYNLQTHERITFTECRPFLNEFVDIKGYDSRGWRRCESSGCNASGTPNWQLTVRDMVASGYYCHACGLVYVHVHQTSSLILPGERPNQLNLKVSNGAKVDFYNKDGTVRDEESEDTDPPMVFAIGPPPKDLCSQFEKNKLVVFLRKANEHLSGKRCHVCDAQLVHKAFMALQIRAPKEAFLAEILFCTECNTTVNAEWNLEEPEQCCSVCLTARHVLLPSRACSNVKEQVMQPRGTPGMIRHPICYSCYERLPAKIDQRPGTPPQPAAPAKKTCPICREDINMG